MQLEEFFLNYSYYKMLYNKIIPLLKKNTPKFYTLLKNVKHHYIYNQRYFNNKAPLKFNLYEQPRLYTKKPLYKLLKKPNYQIK